MTLARRVLAGIAAGSLWVVALPAQAPGRLSGIVSDETGAPLAEVRITVTDPEAESFELSATTKKNGKYAFLIKDVTRPYLCRFEREGFQTQELTVKIPFNSNLERDLTMPSLESLRASRAGTSEPIASDAPAPSMAADPAILVFNDGVAAVRAGEVDTAEKKFEEAIALDPDLVQAHVALSALRLRAGRSAEAALGAEKALELEPGDLRAMKIRYQAYRALGDEDSAGRALAELRAASPEAAQEDLYNRGVGAFNSGKIDEAKALFAELLDLEPEHARSHYMLGMCHVNSGESDKAIPHFETFLELAPDDPDASVAREMLGFLTGN